jgi:hypothetical protein
MPQMYGTKKLGAGDKALTGVRRRRRAEEAMERIKSNSGRYEEAMGRIKANSDKYEAAMGRIMAKGKSANKQR